MDDVTEFAEERTAARELHGCRSVAVPPKQIEPRHRDCGHVGFLGLFISGFDRSAGSKSVQECRPCFLSFPYETDIAKCFEDTFAHRHEWSASDDHRRQ